MPSSNEFAVIEELVDILKPFNDATEILSGDLYRTLEIVQLVFHQFSSEILASKAEDRDTVKKLKIQLGRICLQDIKRKKFKQCSLWLCIWIHDSRRPQCLQQRRKPVRSRL